MNKSKKRAAMAALILCCLSVFLPSCSPSVTYRNDLSATELMTRVEVAAPSEAGYRSVEEDYLSPSTFGEDLDLIRRHVTDWAVAVSDRSDSHPDQILIFRTEGDDSNSLRAVTDAVRRYGEALQVRLGDYYRMYAPEELSKLDNLSVKTCGRYVLLTVLDEAQTKAAQTAFEQALM